jgi:peptidoglycan/LPS O-acetylase OafA/YrhL
LFVQSYFPHYWGHTWSLAVEEHFYLLLPLLLIALVRGRSGAKALALLPWVCVVVAAVDLGLRCYMSQYPFVFSEMMFPTHLRLDSLMLGVLLSYWFHFHEQRTVAFCSRFAWWLYAGGIVLLLPVFIWKIEDHAWMYTVGVTMFSLASVMLIAATLGRPIGNNRLTRALAYFGTFSYSIYLWHGPVKWWGLPTLTWAAGTELSTWVTIPFYFVASLAVGVLMAKLVEMPVLHLRDRFFPSRSRPLSISSTTSQP